MTQILFKGTVEQILFKETVEQILFKGIVEQISSDSPCTECNVGFPTDTL